MLRSPNTSPAGRRHPSLQLLILLGLMSLAGASRWGERSSAQTVAPEGAEKDKPAAPKVQVTLLYTVNNLGYTDTCG